MVTLMKEPKMNRRSINRNCRRQIGPGSPIAPLQKDDEIRCFLQMSGAELPVDVPIAVLNEHRRAGRQVVLRVPGQPVPVESMPPDTAAEWARGWIAEMESFDHF